MSDDALPARQMAGQKLVVASRRLGTLHTAEESCLCEV
jgi:hypothetical protein